MSAIKTIGSALSSKVLAIIGAQVYSSFIDNNAIEKLEP